MTYAAPLTMDDAAAPKPQRPLGYENRLVALFALAGGISGLDALTVYFLLPFIAADMALSNTQIGALSLAVSIGWALSSLLTGALSDRLGRRKPFLIVAFVMFALFSGLSAVASTFVMLLGARLLMGLAEGPVIPIQQAIVMAESSPRRRGLNMGIVQNLGSQGIGSLLGPLIIIQLALLLGWRAAFLVAGVPALIIAILIAWYVREPVRIKDVRLPDSTSGGATKLFAPFRFRNVCLCAIIGSASAAWYYLLLTFLPIWLVRELGMTETDMSIVVSAIGLAGVVWSIVMPWLSDRFGRQRIMILAAACGALAPLVALLSGPNIVVLVIFTFLGGTTIALFPLSCIVPLETVPAREAATTTAIIVAMSTIMGGGIGPIVGGMLADSFGLQITLIAALAMIFVAVGAALGLQETAPASLEMTA